MLVPLTSHLLPVLQADALTRRNAGEAASQSVVRRRYQAPPHAAVSNLGECVMVLGLLAMTAELQPHLGDDFLDAGVQPNQPTPPATAARQQAGQRAGISEAFAVAIELPLAGAELGGRGLHGRAVEPTCGFQARDDVAPALGFGDLRLIHRRNVERRPWPG